MEGGRKIFYLELFAPFVRLITSYLVLVQIKIPTVTGLHEELLGDEARPTSKYTDDDKLIFTRGLSREKPHQ